MVNPTHTVSYEVQESWARFGSAAWQYVTIAQAAYIEHLADESEPVARPSDEEAGESYYAQQRRIFANSVKTVVFCGMALEAAIYDLAAIQLGDKFALEVLDKLDVLQKWLVVPRLICGKSLRESGPGINALRTVVKARNALVHAKSAPATQDPSDLQKMEKRSAQLLRDVHESYRCVVFLSLEINSLLGTVAGVLPPFERKYISSESTEMPSSLLRKIELARETHLRGEA